MLGTKYSTEEGKRNVTEALFVEELYRIQKNGSLVLHTQRQTSCISLPYSYFSLSENNSLCFTVKANLKDTDKYDQE